MDSELLAWILLVPLIVTGFMAYLSLSGFRSGAGYEPVPDRILEIMFALSKPDSSKRVFDLGSGLGKIVITVATRFHAKCTGVEVDSLKVWWTRREIRRRGLGAYAAVVKGNLLDADLSSADLVYVFLWDGIMQKLKQKVLREMKPGSVIVSYYHQFHEWKPETEDEKNKVYLYRVPGS